MLSQLSYPSVGAPAKRAEEVGEGADAGERKREIEAPILRTDNDRARQVVLLILHHEAAALRIVEAGPALLNDVTAGNVPVHDVGPARSPAHEIDRRCRVDGVIGVRV